MKNWIFETFNREIEWEKEVRKDWASINRSQSHLRRVKADYGYLFY